MKLLCRDNVAILIAMAAASFGLGSCLYARRQINQDTSILRLSVEAEEPEYSLDSGVTWHKDTLSSMITQMLQYQMAMVTAPVYESNNLVSAEAKRLFASKLQQCKDSMKSLEMQIPLKVNISNCGHRDTTITSGMMTITGYDRAVSRRGSLGNLNILVPEGSIISLTNIQSVAFKNLEDVPKIITAKALANGMKTWMFSFGYSDDKWQEKFPENFGAIMGVTSPSLMTDREAKVILEFIDFRGVSCRGESPICGTLPFKIIGTTK